MRVSRFARGSAVVAALCLLHSVCTAQLAVRVESGIVHGFSDSYRTTVRVSYPKDATSLQPLLVLVPGLGSSHTAFGREADSFATAGYFVVTYDVRGQASTKTLNQTGGSKLWSLREWEDLAEIIEWVGFRWRGLADTSRIGVFGDSQGGVHAWASAAFSDKALPGSLRIAKFPKILAVVPRIMAPQTTDVLVPDGVIVHERLGSWFADDSSAIVKFEAGFKAKGKTFLDANDPAGLAAWLRSVPGRDFADRLRVTSVPIFCQMSWLDEFLAPDRAIRALESLPVTTPRRLLMATGFHGTPLNTYQFIMRQRRTLAWFDYYVKQEKVGSDGGPLVVSAAMPADPRQYQLLQSLWRLRDDARFPAADTKKLRLDLDVFGRLRSQTQDVFSGRRRISQRVLKSYDWRDFARDRENLGVVAAALPVDKFEFASSPFAQDIELAGDGFVSLRVVPVTAPYQIGVRVFAEDAEGRRQLLTAGGRSWSGTETADRKILLGSSAAVLPAGTRLVLEVSNHILQRPGAKDAYRAQPEFKPFAVDLDFPAGRVARLELTVRDEPRVDLGTGVFDIDVAAPKPVEMFVQTSTQRAKTFYFLLLSLTPPAEAPVPGGRTFWFSRDSFTDLVFQFATTPAFAGFVGLTDDAGVARPSLNLDQLPALPPALRGLNLYACPILVPGPVIEAGSTIEFRFN